MQEINVALIGYNFMGKAHSHAFENVPFFFDHGVKPVKKSNCRQNGAFGQAGGGKVRLGRICYRLERCNSSGRHPRDRYCNADVFPYRNRS